MNVRKKNRRRSDTAIAYAIIRTTVAAVIAGVIVTAAATVVSYKVGVANGRAERADEIVRLTERNLELRRRLEE